MQVCCLVLGPLAACRSNRSFFDVINIQNRVAVQRQAKKKGGLNEERTKKLDEIEFAWSMRKSSNKRSSTHTDWNHRFRELLEYKMAVGDCNVPQKFSINPPLGNYPTINWFSVTLVRGSWFTNSILGCSSSSYNRSLGTNAATSVQEQSSHQGTPRQTTVDWFRLGKAPEQQ